MRRQLKVRPLVATAMTMTVLALSGCSQAGIEQWGRWGLPVAASDRAPYTGSLWNGAWTASMIVGVLVWGLIFYAIIRFRRKSPSDVPRQSQYNLPMEIMYTIVPFLIIGVLFFYTVRTQDKIHETSATPQHVIKVVGQKWSWTFNYMEQDNPAVGAVVHEAGTIEKIPDLVLPAGESVKFVLDSADVIHSFWVPEFYYKLDVIPGRTNTFEVTPTLKGEYKGKCAELCGTYHAAMLFTVKIVDPADYTTYVNSLKSKGQTGEIAPPAYITALPVPPIPSAKESGR